VWGQGPVLAFGTSVLVGSRHVERNLIALENDNKIVHIC